VSLDSEISELIDFLQLPVSDAEKAFGWTRQGKDDSARALKDVLEKIRTNVPIEYFGIVRALDFRGVFGGQLLERVALVANHINETFKN